MTIPEQPWGWLTASAASPAQLAPRLLGARIRSAGVCLLITEVEGYGGADDPGSHARRGQTPRCARMFGRPGTAYVYLSYGVHRCLNVVIGPEGTAAAVLIRAGRVLGGGDLARARRNRRRQVQVCDDALARGPGALGQALGIELAHDGADLIGTGADDGPRLLPALTDVARQIRSGPRVGVAGAGGDGARYPWRFWLDGDPTVSRYRAATRGPSGSVRRR